MTVAGGRIDWTPDRIEALRVLVAGGTSDGQCARILGVTRGVISGARWRFGMVSENADKYACRPMPDDFRTFGITLSVEQGTKHYKAASRTIRKWFDMLRIAPPVVKRVYVKKVRPAPPVRVVFVPSYRAPRRTTGKNAHLRFNIPERSATMADSAQLFLQRYGPVIRASTIDRFAPDGQWIVLGRRMAEADMLEAATRKGWGARAA